MKLPSSQFQHSQFSHKLQLALILIAMAFLSIISFSGSLHASTFNLSADGQQTASIEIIEDRLYFTSLPFKPYSPEGSELVEAIIAFGLVDQPSDIQLLKDSISFDISPEFTLGECSFSKGSYSDVVDRQKLEAAKQRCHGYCDAVSKSVDYAISKLTLPEQYKLAIIALVEVAARKAHKCCASDESFMYDCFAFIVDAYERAGKQQQADWEQFKQDANSYLDYRRYERRWP